MCFSRWLFNGLSVDVYVHTHAQCACVCVLSVRSVVFTEQHNACRACRAKFTFALANTIMPLFSSHSLALEFLFIFFCLQNAKASIYTGKVLALSLSPCLFSVCATYCALVFFSTTICGQFLFQIQSIRLCLSASLLLPLFLHKVVSKSDCCEVNQC